MIVVKIKDRITPIDRIKITVVILLIFIMGILIL